MSNARDDVWDLAIQIALRGDEVHTSTLKLMGSVDGEKRTVQDVLSKMVERDHLEVVADKPTSPDRHYVAGPKLQPYVDEPEVNDD